MIVLNASGAAQTNAVQALTATLLKTESTKTSLKQKILLNLYNALPGNQPLRYDAFTALVEVTVQADELDSLYGQLDHIDAWAKQWGIDADTQRKLYRFLSEKLNQAGDEYVSCRSTPF